ncbi:Polysaccharide deacetylase [Citrifermentans bremense]|uniref:Polysaccharide deacetylase n=1 Tax=Citrifermentans bremense TaxID=60035 RepID=A0A6S6M8A5_9BACT|nr:XrtA system polysaccharide deacetylase [Citrifermentans bremense]BCG47655.1 Polysaccharide deacetylase [Citrifermentans bremense]
MLNALTIDVEDYFQVNAFEPYIPRECWDHYPLRVADNVARLLDLLDEYQVKATFFVLGWVAERVPRTVREIQARGHEVASHGYGHQLIFRIGPQAFRDDIRRAKEVLEDITGSAVRGYRAPTYSITRESLWAFDLLLEAGFSFDSSVFPVYHDTYGIPDAPRFPYLVRRPAGTLQEFPLTTLPLKLAGKSVQLPIAGGGYLRLLPVALIKWGIDRINRVEQKPCVLYLHPWEIDPGQPRIKAGWKSRFRHYNNLERTEEKLRYLLKGVRYGTMSQVLGL